jgi:hypothetical protein
MSIPFAWSITALLSAISPTAAESMLPSLN